MQCYYQIFKLLSYLEARISLSAFNAVVSGGTGVALRSNRPDRPRCAWLSLEHHDLLLRDPQAVDPVHEFQTGPRVASGTEVPLQTWRAGVSLRSYRTLPTNDRFLSIFCTRAVPIPIPKESQFQFLGLFWHLVME